MTDKLKPIRPRIVIDETEGPGGTPLKQCFFMSTELEGAYNIYDSKARLLAAYVVSGSDFNLTVEGAHFFISGFAIDDVAASGSFSVGHHKHLRAAGEFEPDGSFQASSGPGDPAEDDVESVAPAPPPGAIVINGVLGTSDKDKLKGMYFMLAPGPVTTYNLYNKSGKWIESGIQSGIVFTFPHDSFVSGGGQSQKIVWTITDFVISSTAASGKWTNTDPSITGEQGGSFQASSGPGADPEAVSAASA